MAVSAPKCPWLAWSLEEAVKEHNGDSFGKSSSASKIDPKTPKIEKNPTDRNSASKKTSDEKVSWRRSQNG
ncbi:hypothetical protein RND71_041040 [Anisodus tanguticus]|uniref:Uncharacterized protein n=1 Tax=Anisodus tanguticus TaxID=243964 RepID=A0AAE1UPH1_9SOLA|nr:hypothetical protein RND71_041040 [Anisodus tanguticus]